MKKRFRSRKRSKNKFIYLIVFLFLISFIITIVIRFKINYHDDLTRYLYQNTINNLDQELLPGFGDFFLNYTTGVNNSIYLESNPSFLGDYVIDPTGNDLDSEPLIYIYNTHQTESYQYLKNNTYNVDMTVLVASYMLREKLKDLGINAYVESNNIKEILNANNWAYKYSYDASRILINNYLQNHQPLLLIDLHRDSSSYEKTTITFQNNQYARLLFVVGKKHVNYELNYQLASYFNEEIKKVIPDISRGITLKDGNGVNGIYNQDISDKTVLIEVGGQYNDIKEVNNTLEVLSKVLANYVRKEET